MTSNWGADIRHSTQPRHTSNHLAEHSSTTSTNTSKQHHQQAALFVKALHILNGLRTYACHAALRPIHLYRQAQLSTHCLHGSKALHPSAEAATAAVAVQCSAEQILLLVVMQQQKSHTELALDQQLSPLLSGSSKACRTANRQMQMYMPTLPAVAQQSKSQASHEANVASTSCTQSHTHAPAGSWAHRA